MDPNPPVKSPAESETRPSLLATMSLNLALVPYVLLAQLLAQLIIPQFWYLPSWLSRIFSNLMPMQMLVMLVSPLISIICGIIASSRMKHDRSLQGGRKVRVGVYLALIFYPCLFLAPQLNIPRPKVRAAACISNLKALSTAITMYADDHENQMPATLAELANGTYLLVGSTTMQCPMSQKPYRYPGAGRIWQTNMNEISAYCGTDHIGQTNALFNDGRVMRTTSAAVKASVAAIRATTSQDKPGC